jgi:hypothetical protein
MIFNNPWSAIQEHMSLQYQTGENAARPAWSTCHIETLGAGEFVIEDVLEFGCTFVDEPSVTYGSSRGEDGPEFIAGSLPRTNGMVVEYQRSEKGYYLGAFVVLTVDVPSASVDYVINHYFTFGGIALKDLPDYLLDQ